MLTVEAEGHDLTLALDKLILLVDDSTVSVNQLHAVDSNVAAKFIHIQISN